MKLFDKLVIGLVLTASAPAMGQLPDFSKVPNLWENDSLNIVYLVQHGIPITKKKVICWFPADSMTSQRMNEIADTINAGVTSAEEFIHAPLPWQVHRFDEPYVFYFRPDSFISHASMAGLYPFLFGVLKTGKRHGCMKQCMKCLIPKPGFGKTPPWFQTKTGKKTCRCGCLKDYLIIYPLKFHGTIIRTGLMFFQTVRR